jgi:hypothetical protein
MKKRLLVRGFDSKTRERHLRELFSKYGPLGEVKIRKSSWRNKYGYSGSVEVHAWRAEFAIYHLNGTTWRGRRIWVRYENET